VDAFYRELDIPIRGGAADTMRSNSMFVLAALTPPRKLWRLALKLKSKRIYAPRIVADHIMVQEDFAQLHKFLSETEGLLEVSDDMRELVEEEWPELVHKLSPKVPTRR
jgi:hypothetical protein